MASAELPNSDVFMPSFLSRRNLQGCAGSSRRQDLRGLAAGKNGATVSRRAALAATTTMLLLLLGTPVAWWLARTRSRLKGVVAAVVALPLVLPPTVIGFYLLLLLGPRD